MPDPQTITSNKLSNSTHTYKIQRSTLYANVEVELYFPWGVKVDLPQEGLKS